VNTETFEFRSQGTSHFEGSWPRDVDLKSKETVIRYKRKIERSKPFGDFLVRAAHEAIACVQVSNAVDVYEPYFEQRRALHSSSEIKANDLRVFKDPKLNVGIKRSVSAMDWHPDGVLLAAAFCKTKFGSLQQAKESYVWDVTRPGGPLQDLLPVSPVTVIKYNPRDFSCIGAGLHNGLVAMFDVRTGSTPMQTSPIDKSHSDSVWGFDWVQGRSGMEFTSSAADSLVLWWDARKLSEPLDSMKLEESSGKAWGGSSQAYHPSAGISRVLVGTEQGAVVSCNRGHKSESINFVYQSHHAHVVAVARNPAVPKYFLTVGDWQAKIWQESMGRALIATSYHTEWLTGGCWNPIQPTVFYTIDRGGGLNVHDLAHKLCDPVYRHKIGNVAVSSLAAERQGRLLTCGDSEGTITLLELSDGLALPEPRRSADVLREILTRESFTHKHLMLQEKRVFRDYFDSEASGGSSSPHAHAHALDDAGEFADVGAPHPPPTDAGGVLGAALGNTGTRRRRAGYLVGSIITAEHEKDENIIKEVRGEQNRGGRLIIITCG
jgi:dynein intermediate chain 2